MRDKKKWLASDGKTELRPGMLVLVRDKEGEQWGVSVFAYWDDVYVCASNFEFESCIQLVGNESLAGTDAPIPEPRQDAPQPDTHFEWGELVRVWDDDLDDKIGALFVRELAYTQSPYEVLEHGRAYFTQWKHCERV